MNDNWNLIIRHEPFDQLVALFTRDALGVGSVDGWDGLSAVIPGLGVVAPASSGLIDDVVRSQWQDWWRQLNFSNIPHDPKLAVAIGSGRGLEEYPSLQQAVAPFLERAQQWAYSRRDEMRSLRASADLDLQRPETMAIQQIIRGKIDRAHIRRDFVFTELPLQGSRAWIGPGDQVIVTRDLFFDGTQYRHWLATEFTHHRS